MWLNSIHGSRHRLRVLDHIPQDKGVASYYLHLPELRIQIQKLRPRDVKDLPKITEM